MYTVSYTDPLFVIKDINQYILSIWFSSDGLSFFIYSPENKKILLIREQKLDAFNSHQSQTEYEKTINKEPLLNYDYQETRLFIETDKINIIPDSFYEKEIVTTFGKLIKQKKSDAIINNHNNNHRLIFSFKLHDATQCYIKNQFYNNEIHSSWEVFYELALEWIKQNEKTPFKVNTLFVKLKEKEVSLLATNGTMIIMANGFSTKNETDDAYYILNSFKTLNFDALKSPVVVFGDSTNKEKVTQQLKKFIKNVKDAELNMPSITNGQSFEYSFHHYIEIFYSCICEL